MNQTELESLWTAGAPGDQPDPLRPTNDEPRASIADPSKAEYSDDSLALKFSREHGNSLRYTAAWARWSVWNGSRWSPDTTLAIVDLARRLCRAESAACVACGDSRTAQRIADAQTVYAVERLARADRRHAATVDQWDSDPWLLNTPGGVVDLKSGGIRPGRREDYMTKQTAVAPGGACPNWMRFLDQVTSDDCDLERFLQRMCGYALTGITWEHALFFLYGTGANGKSVFINTIADLLGDYAKPASIETFIDSKHQNHPTDVAGLQGARLVTSIETEEGRRWAESKLKSLTGGDAISARFMRQDFFEFTPQFKLIIAGNHKPGLRNIDEAIRRRFHLVPFLKTIPAAERDPKLTENLREEWPGILQWAIDGCLNWQQQGLNAPPAVKEATEAYFASEDALGRWLEDCTEKKNGAWASSTELFLAWKAWADTNGELPAKQKRFSENLIARGYRPARKNSARGFDEIRLRGHGDG